MKTPRNTGNIISMFLILILIGVSIVGIPRWLDPLPSGEIQMGMVVVFAIGTLLILLNITAFAFSKLGLANHQQALGLPEGSIRALIALFLIMIFVIVSVYLFRTVAAQSDLKLPNLTSAQVVELGARVMNIQQNQAGTFDVIMRAEVSETGKQLALQLVTVLGTLVTAVSAFYFGSSSSQQRDAASTSAKRVLSVESISPVTATAAAGKVEIVITGTGFVDGATVKLVKTGTFDTIETTKAPVVSSLEITCTFDLMGKSGQWDVVVINPDKNQATKLNAFQII